MYFGHDWLGKVEQKGSTVIFLFVFIEKITRSNTNADVHVTTDRRESSKAISSTEVVIFIVSQDQIWCFRDLLYIILL